MNLIFLAQFFLPNLIDYFEELKSSAVYFAAVNIFSCFLSTIGQSILSSFALIRWDPVSVPQQDPSLYNFIAYLTFWKLLYAHKKHENEGLTVLHN